MAISNVNARTIKITMVSLAVVFLISVMVPAAFSVGATFGSVINLSNNADSSVNPQIALSGSNIYTVWQDKTNTPPNYEIFYSNSTDGGSNFSNPSVLSTVGDRSFFPEINATGSHVYVVWEDLTVGSGDIMFVNSTDSGKTFSAPVNLSNDAGLSSSPQVAASGSNVYVVWIDATAANNGTLFKRSTDGGKTFGSTINLSHHVASTTPEIAVSGNNVYVVWEDDTFGSGDILLGKSTDGGSTFISPVNLSNDVGLSQFPQIAASGSNVYVVWDDRTSGNTGIFYRSSTNGGTSFSNSINLSNDTPFTTTTPQVKVSGSNVYVIWQDNSAGNNEIFYKNSSDGGATFGSVTNLSSNSGNSFLPELDVSGHNVYVTWADLTPGNQQIFFKPSDNDGLSFGGFSNLANDAGTSTNPQIVASGNNAFMIWQDNTPGNNDIFFIKATNTVASVSFDTTQYKQSQTATITVNDPSASGSVSVNVKSASDNPGIQLTLPETGSGTGVFTGSISFTAASSSGSTLKASVGDTITATYGTITGTASIFPRTIDFNNILSIDSGAIATVRAIDQNSNLDPSTRETITANVATNANPQGIPLTLTETGPNTGIFIEDQLIFMTSNNLFPTSGTVTVTEQCANNSPPCNTAGTKTVNVNSTSDSTAISLVLNETGPTTGIFTGKLTLSPTTHVAGSTIKVSAGDFVRVQNPGNLVSNGLVTPNTNSSNGALLITSPADNVTASYLGATGTASVGVQSGLGGSGGGLVSPGLVLDVIASLSHGGSNYVPPSLTLNGLASTPGGLPDSIRNEVLNHDPLKPMSPSNDQSFDFPFTLDGGGYVLAGLTNTITTQTEKTGTPVDIKLNIPSSTLTHVALYTNLRGNARDIDKSDTFIIYDKDKPLQIVDPHGYFTNVKFDLSTTGIKNTIDYKITFAKPMAKSDIDLRVWDQKMASSDNRILDAWQVEPSSTTAPSQTAPASTSIITPPATSITTIQNTPTVLENTPDLMPAIKDWGGYSSNPISDSDLLSKMGIQGQYIPSWVMKTTKWVVDGELSNQEFENMVKYLASTGTVK